MLRWGRSYYADPTGLIWQEDRGHKAMRGRKCQGAHREEKQEVPRWENERKLLDNVVKRSLYRKRLIFSFWPFFFLGESTGLLYSSENSNRRFGQASGVWSC